MSPWAVRKTTGSGSSAWASASCNSRPPGPGICRSSTAQPTASKRRRVRNCSAEPKVSTWFSGPAAAGQSAEKRRIVIQQIDDRRDLTLDLALGGWRLRESCGLFLFEASYRREALQWAPDPYLKRIVYQA